MSTLSPPACRWSCRPRPRCGHAQVIGAVERGRSAASRRALGQASSAPRSSVRTVAFCGGACRVRRQFPVLRDEARGIDLNRGWNSATLDETYCAGSGRCGRVVGNIEAHVQIGPCTSHCRGKRVRLLVESKRRRSFLACALIPCCSALPCRVSGRLSETTMIDKFPAFEA